MKAHTIVTTHDLPETEQTPLTGDQEQNHNPTGQNGCMTFTKEDGDTYRYAIRFDDGTICASTNTYGSIIEASEAAFAVYGRQITHTGDEPNTPSNLARWGLYDESERVRAYFVRMNKGNEQRRELVTHRDPMTRKWSGNVIVHYRRGSDLKAPVGEQATLSNTIIMPGMYATRDDVVNAAVAEYDITHPSRNPHPVPEPDVPAVGPGPDELRLPSSHHEVMAMMQTELEGLRRDIKIVTQQRDRYLAHLESMHRAIRRIHEEAGEAASMSIDELAAGPDAPANS